MMHDRLRREKLTEVGRFLSEESERSKKSRKKLKRDMERFLKD